MVSAASRTLPVLPMLPVTFRAESGSCESSPGIDPPVACLAEQRSSVYVHTHRRRAINTRLQSTRYETHSWTAACDVHSGPPLQRTIHSHDLHPRQVGPPTTSEGASSGPQLHNSSRSTTMWSNKAYHGQVRSTAQSTLTHHITRNWDPHPATAP